VLAIVGELQFQPEILRRVTAVRDMGPSAGPTAKWRLSLGLGGNSPYGVTQPDLLGGLCYFDRPLEDGVGVLPNGLNADELPALVPQLVESRLNRGISVSRHQVESLQFVGPDDHGRTLHAGSHNWQQALRPRPAFRGRVRYHSASSRSAKARGPPAEGDQSSVLSRRFMRK